MLIVPHACAEFRDKSGQTIVEITPNKLNSFLDVPDAIQEDPLFALMMADGSLVAARSVDQRRSLENDPLAGITAEGKKLIPESDSIPETPAEGKRTRKSVSKVAAVSKESPAETPASVTAEAIAVADEAASAAAADPASDETDPASIPTDQETAGKTSRKSVK